MTHLDFPTPNPFLKHPFSSAHSLSAYDLPTTDTPTSVTMSYAESNGTGNEVSTGPPAAKHRDHANSFKFGKASSSSLSTMSNQLELSAPLSTLFESTVSFTLTYANPARNLTSTVTIHKTLRVNETQWLILNLHSAMKGTPLESSESESTPTLRLKLRVEGPYRPEVAAVINLANSWFHAVDAVTDATVGTTTGFVRDIPKNFPAVQLLLVPTVPLATIGVVALPIVAGVSIVCLPFLLPVLMLLLTIGAISGAVGGGLYFSTREGRTRIQHVAEPSYQTFLMTKTGQRIVYDVGPRPSPQALAHAVLPQDMMGKLVASLFVDLVGSASYLIPLAGEAFDLTWAPISMVLVGAMYDDVMPTLKYVALMEELLPLTDWIPSATLGWVKEFGPGILDIGVSRLNNVKRAGRREREAVVSMSR